jgi:hypothetical protein
MEEISEERVKQIATPNASQPTRGAIKLLLRVREFHVDGVVAAVAHCATPDTVTMELVAFCSFAAMRVNRPKQGHHILNTRCWTSAGSAM